MARRSGCAITCASGSNGEAALSALLQGLPPIAAPGARVLILGSMPGAASLAAGQYYAHPRNAFWRIMGALVGAGPDKPYDERVHTLAEKRIALWDVLRNCVRPGSLDSDIADEVPNDFRAFFAGQPGIRRIGLNGGAAAKFFRKYAAHLAPSAAMIAQLPSTSPAHAARSFEQKCVLWRDLLAL